MAVMKQVSETGENNAVMQEKVLGTGTDTGVSPGGICLWQLFLGKFP